MNRGCRAAIALALLLAMPARADEFSEFRIPEHRLLSWTGDVSSRLRTGRSGGGAFSQSYGYANGLVATGMQWIDDSDASRTRCSFSGNVEGTRQHADQLQTYVSQVASSQSHSSTGSKSIRESWAASIEQRGYPWRAPVGWQAGVSGSGNCAQGWDHRTSRDNYSAPSIGRSTEVYREHSSQWVYAYTAAADLGFGYGRVRDATGVLDARVFEERLLGAGAIARPLSPQARQRLAALAYTQYAFVVARDRGAKDLWRAIEQILREDGALPEGAPGLVATSRAVEPYLGAYRQIALATSPVARQAGGFVGVVATGRHQNSFYRADLSSSRQSFRDDTLAFDETDFLPGHGQSEQDLFLAGVRAEYHRPLGMRWQLDASQQLSVPLQRQRDGMELDGSAQLTWIVAERWLAQGFVNHQRLIDRAGGPGAALASDSWAISYGASASFYLEDRVQLRLGVDERQQARNSGSASDRALNFVLGVTYRIAGRLAVPGFASP